MINTTTNIVRLVNSPESSRIIGQLTSQQGLAYNHAVNVLNREPNIPKRAKKGSRYGLNKRITRWRNTELVERGIEPAPYHIHQHGSEGAWDANALMQDKRLERQERIARAIAAGHEPHPSDLAPHRRTLAHRSRKHGTQTPTRLPTPRGFSPTTSASENTSTSTSISCPKTKLSSESLTATPTRRPPG